MSKTKILNIKRRLEKAIKDNKTYLEQLSSPHDKDMVRCRINVLKHKLITLEQKNNGT